MNVFIGKATRKVFVRSGLMLAIIATAGGSSTGCNPCILKGSTKGSVAESAAAQKFGTEGRALIAAVQTEIRDRINMIAGGVNIPPVVKALLLPTSGGGQILVTNSEIDPVYGVYTETSPDIFDFLAQPTTKQIRIEFLNGVDARLTNFVFSTEQVPHVDIFQLIAESDKRLIDTPIVDTMNLQVTFNRRDVDSISGLTGVFGGLNHSFLELHGEAQYYRLAESKLKTFRIDTRGTQLKPTNTGTIVRATIEEVKDVTNGVQGAPFYNYSESYTYRESEFHLNTYIATNMSFSYNDHRSVSGQMTITEDEFTRTNPDVVGYNGTGTARYMCNWVAQSRGGSYKCDPTNPASVGTGIPIVFDWMHGDQQALMPNTDTFTCAGAIIVDTSPIAGGLDAP